MPKKRLFVDMDGTLARFHDQVNYLERMYEKDFFRNLEPFENMVSGLRLFMNAHPDVEVYILSAKVLGEPPYCEAEKHAWLDVYLPDIDRDHRIFTEPGISKADYIPGGVTQDDYLLDDYNRGLNLFLHSGGRAIKCHNNINQQGLGQHGGSAGHLWMGPIVHTSDTPAMIAAELGQHMGLQYQLEDVFSAYPKIAYFSADANEQAYSPDYDKHLKQVSADRYLAVDTTSGAPSFYGFCSPLNALRFLSGNEDFREYFLGSSDNIELSATAQELRAVCFNVYQNTDYTRYLRADRTQLADVLLDARAASKHPLIGQINYLHTGGQVSYSRLFLNRDEMLAELDACREVGAPVSEEWFIPQEPASLHELTDPSSLTDRLLYEYGFTETEAASTAGALLTSYQDRTSDQMQDLVAAWHNHEIPGSLQTFLRLSDQEMQHFVSPAANHPTSPQKANPFHLLPEHKITNIAPFVHTPGNREEEGPLLSAIGGALEEDFSCFTADFYGEPFVFIVSPDINFSSFLWSYARMQAWASLRFDAFCEDPSISPLRLYLDNRSDQVFLASVYAALPASMPPEQAVKCLDRFQSGFRDYFYSYGVKNLNSFEQDYTAMYTLVADVIEGQGAYKLSKAEVSWLTADAKNIVCDALLSYARYQNAGHKTDPPEVQTIDKRRICNDQVAQSLSRLRTPITLSYPDAQGREVSFSLPKGELLLTILQLHGYTPLKSLNTQSFSVEEIMRIHKSYTARISDKKPSLGTVIQNADGRTTEKAYKDRSVDPER